MTSLRFEVVLLFALSVLACVSARKNFDCQVFEVDTQFDNSQVEHDHGPKWHCFPEPEASGERYELEEIPDDIIDEVKGGGKWIHIQGPFVNPAGKIPPGAEISLAARERLDQGGRRTIRNIGQSSVLVVRVTFLDSAPTSSAAEIGDSVFGDAGDPVNLVSQYAACSKGQLTFSKANGSNIVEGVLDVSVPENIAAKDRYTAADAAEDAAIALVGSIGQFDHVMYCLPPGLSGWIAYGYYNWRRTVFNDEWCTYVSAQMHEFGHNLNLRHSGENVVVHADGSQTNAYADQTGMMGYSYSQDDTPVMCFNPVKSYQLGWFDDCIIDVTDLSVTTQRKLVGTADYQPGACAQDDAVVVRVVTGQTLDVYVGFNKATGSNAGTVEKRDVVTITEGSLMETSDLVAALAVPGESHTYGSSFVVKFCALEGGKPVVGVARIGEDPCPPGCSSDADCDDALFCNGAETCVSGACEAGAPPCAGQVCDENTDACVECVADSDCAGATPMCADSVCVECVSDADCLDDVFCNGAEVCSAGACQAGDPVVCDNGDFCDGEETCDEAAGACAAGEAPCSGALSVCDEEADACFECVSNEDCDDGSVCNGVETCNTVTNKCEAGTPTVCDDGAFCNGAETCDEAAGGACTAGSAPCSADEVCDEAADQCLECLSDADCDDALFCNGAETCVSGACTAGSAACAGGEVCIEDTDACVECVANSDCADQANPVCADSVCVACVTDGDCDNGLYCDGAEVCSAGACQAGDHVVCDNGDFCDGEETCDEASDACAAGTAPCDDELFCNGVERCDEIADACTAGPAPCDSDTPFCDETAHECLQCSSDADCDDALFCNGAETCVSGACEAGAPPCAGQVCDENTDACVECVADSDCAGATPMCADSVCVECVSDADCLDDVFCNGAEVCSAGACQAGDPVVCDNGDFCDGEETCDEAAGACAAGTAPCDAADGTPVCVEASDSCFECVSDEDCGGETALCSGGVCVGCITDGDCADGVFCNGAETCNAGSCARQLAPCGAELCDEGAGVCLECLSHADCDDGLFCNGAETCAAGTCVSAAAPCDAGLCNELEDVCNEPEVCSGDVDETRFPGCCCDAECSSYNGKGRLLRCCIAGVSHRKGYTCNAAAAIDPAFLLEAEEAPALVLIANKAPPPPPAPDPSSPTLPLLLVVLLAGVLALGLIAAAIFLAVRARRLRSSNEPEPLVQHAHLELETEIVFDVRVSDLEKGSLPTAPPHAEPSRFHTVLLRPTHAP